MRAQGTRVSLGLLRELAEDMSNADKAGDRWAILTLYAMRRRGMRKSSSQAAEASQLDNEILQRMMDSLQGNESQSEQDSSSIVSKESDSSSQPINMPNIQETDHGAIGELQVVDPFEVRDDLDALSFPTELPSQGFNLEGVDELQSPVTPLLQQSDQEPAPLELQDEFEAWFGSLS